MAIQLDLAGHESAALSSLMDEIPQMEILEIGCGDGRLTQLIAANARRVAAIDPKAEKISQAEQGLPAALQQKVEFYAESLEEFAAGNAHSNKNELFDLAVLSWSL